MPAAAPLVSVCVPTYNYGRFIGKCIESVLSQTLRDFELVIVDDCSTDDTLEVVARYRDDRIRLFVNERQLGMTPNLKKAAELGRGTYLRILCSDDWLSRDSLETLVTLLERHPTAVIATGAEVYTDERGNAQFVQFLWGEPVTYSTGSQMLDRMARGHGFGGNSSFLIRASAYHAVGGFDAEVRYAPDYDLAARLCCVGDYVHTDAPVFFGRHHSAASSVVNPARFLDIEDWFEVPSRVFQPRPVGSRNWFRWQLRSGDLANRYLVNAVLQFLRGQPERAKRLLREVIQRATPAMIPLAPVHVIHRLRRKLRPRRHCPIEGWMNKTAEEKLGL